MIKRVYFSEELAFLPQKGVEALKIRALLQAYGTKYDFCRFYVSENVIFCEMNGSFVLSEFGECDTKELTNFLTFNGFTDIFCSETLGKRLSEHLKCGSQRVNLMRFCGKSAECADVEKAPPLNDVFKILISAFEVEYEPWYVDMSHRIRHGISQARKLGDSALMIQHDINGEALLSQIAALPESRGRGNTSRLIASVCAELSKSDVFILCEDNLISFYRKIGFEKTDHKLLITKGNSVK